MFVEAHRVTFRQTEQDSSHMACGPNYPTPPIHEKSRHHKEEKQEDRTTTSPNLNAPKPDQAVGPVAVLLYVVFPALGR